MKVLESSSIPKYKNTINKLPVFIPSIFKRENKIIYDYSVDICEFYQQILPEGYNKTRIWGYGGYCKADNKEKREYIKHYPGPTFEMERYIQAGVKWNNRINGSYLMAVDPTLSWSNPNNITIDKPYEKYPPGAYQTQWPVVTVTHIHGGEVEPQYDGCPNAWYTSNGIKGKQFTTNYYKYLNCQAASTLWYHDFSKGLSRLSLYSGLCGMYIIHDEKKESKLDIPKDKYDIPLIIQDKSFYEDGSIYYASKGDVVEIHPYWVRNFYGNTNIVNGKVWPNMNVENQLYRFRILNASNCRPYGLYLSNNCEFIQIATDGGYISTPKILTHITISPGERVDILIDFSKYKKGDKILLKNFFSKDDTQDIMQFTVIKEDEKIVYKIPNEINKIPKLIPNSKRISSVIIDKIDDDNKVIGGFIDGQTIKYPPSLYTVVGSTFEWDFINVSKDIHPIHIHLVQFQILGRQRIKSKEYLNDWTKINGKVPINKPRVQVDVDNYLLEEFIEVSDFEKGWKDTVYVPPGYVTRIVIRYAPIDDKNENVIKGKNNFPFDIFNGMGYIYNSSIMEDVDNEMMVSQIIIGDDNI